MKNWVSFEGQFMDDYFSGERPLTRENLVRDLRLLGGCTNWTVTDILRRVDVFARGDLDFELGRMLRYRYRYIASKLN